MSKYQDKQFWIDLGDRAISTFAQGALGAILASSVISVVDLDLGEIASIAGLAALVSVLQTVAARNPDPAVQATVVVLPEPEEDIEFHNPDSPQFETETR